MKKIGALIMIILIAISLTSCSFAKLREIYRSTLPQDEVDVVVNKSVVISDLTIAQGQTVLKGGEKVTVKLVMRYGKYLTSDGVALGGGFGNDNYIGSCELQVWQDEISLSSYAISDNGVDTFYSKIGFDLEFDDYNNDNNPDFTIGQWGSSSVNVYSMFTLDENGLIQLISAPYGIYSSDGKSNGYDYSTLFEKTNAGFMVLYYNNGIGEYEKMHYIWEEINTGKFVWAQNETAGR